MTHPIRTMQIHVTRKCNLACLHCYSRSGPQETETLPLDALKSAITDAAGLGYGAVSLSGGEPFLYPDIAPLVAHAKTQGMKTGCVTNGMYLDARRLSALKGALDLVVISLDGTPERHNRMRAHPRAFEIMAGKLANLRDTGIPFGFLFTLSRENAHELVWAAEFAATEGARALQVHPLDDIGRGEALASDLPLLDQGLLAGQLGAFLKARHGGRLLVSVDYQSREMGCMVAGGDRFADLVTTLTVEPDGCVVPEGYGFPRHHAIADLGAGGLADQAARWQAEGGAARFRTLVEGVRARVTAADAPPLTNLAAELRHAAEAEALGIAAE